MCSESIQVKQEFLEAGGCDVIEQIASALVEALRNGNTVYLFGNGGSAADAEHIAVELVTRLDIERKGLPAYALSANSAVLSSLGNAYGFQMVFMKQVEAFVKRGDVVIGISTSGNSANIIAGLSLARELGAVTVSFTGRSGGRLAKVADVRLRVPSTNTQRIQECYLMAAHVVCSLVESALFGGGRS